MANDNPTLDFHYEEQENGPVTCLGMEFENDEARRAYFTEQLKEKLKDPEFRKIEGFPIGTNEAILELSDPPYYTACPNPWIADFIEEWEAEKPKKPVDYHYHREPFAADVSEGKNDPIYNAHTYHTKVPHKAIMRYILHYTDPGDIVLDGFAGTGMTGVAAYMCGNKDAVISLGYQVKTDGSILEERQEEGKTIWIPFSKLGIRRAIINDLSPAATFIAHNYNSIINPIISEQEAKTIIAKVKKEYGWLYETLHTDGSTGTINYTIWSDVYICPECTNEIIYWEAAVDEESGKLKDEFICSSCNALLTKKKMGRAWSTIYDSKLKETIKQVKQVPVIIDYSITGKKGKFRKVPDQFDKELIDKINKLEIPSWFPSERLPYGKETRRNDPIGITHIHHFYTKRNLWILAELWENSPRHIKFFITNFLSRNVTKLNRFVINKHNPKGRVNGPMTGTFYIPSEQVEQNAFRLFEDKLPKYGWGAGDNVISTQSFTKFNLLPNHSLDYLFIDPPFGANINYSELNILWESWLRVATDNKEEAIENSAQDKSLFEYKDLMTNAFKEAYRVLKPGKWMTVEFSNTKASVWNSIQNALSDAGFIIANVSALDKKHGGIRAMSYVTAVKQDLVISAYKPNGGFEARFEKEATTEEGVWDFIRTHLGYLPITKGSIGKLEFIAERDPRILFDQVVAYYVRKGYMVPISSQEFQLELAQRFAERDGMFFLPEQVAEYDKKKMQVKELVQVSLFVSDESSAIAWLRQQLKQKPQTFQDLNPQFMQETSGWSKNEKMLELSTLLEENFLMYEGAGKVPEQIHTHLSTNWKDLRNLDKEDPRLVEKAKNRWYVPDPNKAGDLEKVREKSLLKEFEAYKTEKKKLKLFRIEAVRAGFKKSWQERDYGTIIAIAEKIPNNVLEEDPKLLMWYDQSITRVGDR